MPEHITPKWILKALTPPIVVIAVKGCSGAWGCYLRRRPT